MGTDNRDLQNAADKIADKMYHPSDYHSGDDTERGLAVTHEQASDDYMEGTNDGKIDEYAGEKNVEIPRAGYENMFREAGDRHAEQKVVRRTLKE